MIKYQFKSGINERVRISDINVICTVLAVCLNVEGGRMYRVAYYFNGIRQDVWVAENELEAA